jgi:fatty acid desaturase
MVATIQTSLPHAPGYRYGGMTPDPAALPDVLPTDRLTASGMPVPAIRAELRRIAGVRNACTVLGVVAQSFGVIALAVWIGHPLAYVAAFVLMGRAFALYAILGHEAAHRLLFSSKRWNDLVGKWLLSYPAFVPFDAYRRSHFAHHKDEFGPAEPDLALYANYPTTPASLRRKLVRDAFFVSGWKNLKGLFRGLKNPASRPFATRIVVAQVGILAIFTAFGRPWLYPLFWLAPWMSGWRVINRLRVIGEHGGMTRSDDRRLTTHHVRQSRLARFWMVPFNTGWHLAHHVDMGVPWRNLPKLHDELVASGWFPDRLEYPSYLALWRKASSAPEPVVAAPVAA